MIASKVTSNKLVQELSDRYSVLVEVLKGRQAENKDCNHGLKRGCYTEAKLERSVIIDAYKLRLAVADFNTILAEIKRLK